LVQEVVGILGKQKARLEEELEKEVEECISAAGLSEKHLRDYLKELLDLCERAFPKILAVAKADWKAGAEMMCELERRLFEKCEQTADSLRSRAEEATSGSRCPGVCLPVSCLIPGIYLMTACVLVSYLTEITLPWVVSDAIEHGKSKWLREWAWSWRRIDGAFVGASLALCSDAVQFIKSAWLNNLKISLLENEGQRLLESGQLDELG
jgi:hypothetical protein